MEPGGLSGAEVEGEAALSVGDDVFGEEGFSAGGGGPAVASPAPGLAVMGAVDLAGDGGDGPQGGGVGDAGQDGGGGEQGEESVGGGSPAGAGLGEILEAGEDEEALGAGVGDDGREVGEGSDVGDLVEGEQDRRPRRGAAGGGLVDLVEEGADEGAVLVLGVGGGADVDGVGRVRERFGVEVRVAGGGEGGMGSLGGEDAVGGGPDP